MPAVEIRKGVEVGLDDLVSSLSAWETGDLKLVSERIHQLLSSRSGSNETDREKELLQLIKGIIPASAVRRFRQLNRKQQGGTLSDREREELLLLTDFMESKSAERLYLMGELARMKGVPVSEILKISGIKALHEAA
jgi:DNA-binding CsgD family transcriptional regulator